MRRAVHAIASCSRSLDEPARRFEDEDARESESEEKCEGDGERRASRASGAADPKLVLETSRCRGDVGRPERNLEI